VSRGARAWLLVSALLGVCALAGWPLRHEAIDWQPALGLSEPWRAWSAIGVHYSVAHLAYNLAGLVMVGVFGVVARSPAGLAWAWFAAWPLTQFGLWLKPTLEHYGGLSGVLHAGAAAVLVFLLYTGTRAQRWVAALAALGLCAKVVDEAPWGAALRYPAGWEIAIAPAAHASGALAGALCAAIALLRWRAAGPAHA
jgi:rhomboid family GlyGly-CTERM serine protease